VPIRPDIVSVGKGLGAGHAPLGAVLCTQQVYDALDHGSRQFDLGHTWDGAPLSCAVGAAAIELLVERKLVEHVGDRGPELRNELAAALEGSRIVREVRGRGFLLGVEYVDPRDGTSPLPESVDAADLVDRTALDHGLLVMSTHATPDGFTGDHTVLAPAFTATDDELAEMVERFAGVVRDVEAAVTSALAG
jgi:adenosylmethionine-8-amino-7-oxononanoate aminotransferase